VLEKVKVQHFPLKILKAATKLKKIDEVKPLVKIV